MIALVSVQLSLIYYFFVFIYLFWICFPVSSTNSPCLLFQRIICQLNCQFGREKKSFGIIVLDNWRGKWEERRSLKKKLHKLSKIVQKFFFHFKDNFERHFHFNIKNPFSFLLFFFKLFLFFENKISKNLVNSKFILEILFFFLHKEFFDFSFIFISFHFFLNFLLVSSKKFLFNYFDCCWLIDYLSLITFLFFLKLFNYILSIISLDLIILHIFTFFYNILICFDLYSNIFSNFLYTFRFYLFYFFSCQFSGKNVFCLTIYFYYC